MSISKNLNFYIFRKIAALQMVTDEIAAPWMTTEWMIVSCMATVWMATF